MKQRKSLVLITLAAAFSIFTIATTYHLVNKSKPIAMNTSGFAFIGNPSAPIEIVVIQDFLCKNCRAFSLEILPKIESEYVQKGLARLILVPVAFISGSKIMANAAMEVYQNHPDQFFSFLQAVVNQSKDGQVKPADLVRIAIRLGGIDLKKLQVCMEKTPHNQTLEKNLAWARDFMGPNFRTPAIFINGYPASTFSYLAVKDQINQTLEKRR